MGMRQLQMFTTAELAVMRDRSASRSYSPAADKFRREHERHREWGLSRRHAERLRRRRDSPCAAPEPRLAGGRQPDRTQDQSSSRTPVPPISGEGRQRPASGLAGQAGRNPAPASGNPPGQPILSGEPEPMPATHETAPTPSGNTEPKPATHETAPTPSVDMPRLGHVGKSQSGSASACGPRPGRQSRQGTTRECRTASWRDVNPNPAAKERGRSIFHQTHPAHAADLMPMRSPTSRRPRKSYERSHAPPCGDL